MPLLKYESELFVQTGAWKSLEELESTLTLEELFLLCRASNNEFNKQLQIAAASSGAEVDFDDDWYENDGVKNNNNETITKSNIGFLPIGLGYEG